MADKTIEQLEAQVVSLKNQNEELSAEAKSLLEEVKTLRGQVKTLSNPGVDEAIEELVQDKMDAGLDRDTAIRSAKAQVAWDAELERKEREEKKTAAVKAAIEKSAAEKAEKKAA